MASPSGFELPPGVSELKEWLFTNPPDLVISSDVNLNGMEVGHNWVVRAPESKPWSFAKHFEELLVFISSEDLPNPEQGEFSFISLLDAMHCNIFKELDSAASVHAGERLEKRRNTAEVTALGSSTAPGSRLDLLVLAPASNGQRVVVYRGEEKKDSLSAAQDDLKSKAVFSPIMLGKTPYLVGYAHGGSRLQVFALVPNNLVPLSRELRLNFLPDRLEFVRLSLRLYPVLRKVAEVHCPPPGAPMPGLQAAKISTPAGHPHRKSLFIDVAGVVKVVEGPALVMSRVLDVHAQLKHWRCVVKLTNAPKDVLAGSSGIVTRSLHLAPVGMARVPSNSTELCAALSDILTALMDMHASKWCHTDIRWPNILWKYDKPNWFLIDFDGSVKFGSVIEHTGQEATAAVDLDMVLQLLGDARLPCCDHIQERWKHSASWSAADWLALVPES